jgi:hypothetical protein
MRWHWEAFSCRLNPRLISPGINEKLVNGLVQAMIRLLSISGRLPSRQAAVKGHRISALARFQITFRT